MKQTSHNSVKRIVLTYFKMYLRTSSFDMEAFALYYKVTRQTPTA